MNTDDQNITKSYFRNEASLSYFSFGLFFRISFFSEKEVSSFFCEGNAN